ncbi:YpbS family protein [Neobacillus sp. SM06]|uniref:YpbS family protein n=1 Tax=Neobacillus sp. SM06 TaxID=3422492 RepID=UPI003D26CAFF
MSVHQAITNHVNKQNKRINEFIALDQQRELYIEEAVQRCKEGKAFSTEKINEVTKQINELAKLGIVPSRKLVTPEMVREYVERK